MLEIAVDVGGTFTDLVCRAEGRAIAIAKVPTTAADIVDGIVAGTRQILDRVGGRPEEVRRIIHSTTIATNAVLEHKGARTALLLTEGFEDILEIGRQKRSELYNFQLETQTPTFLAPRRLRAGIAERVDSDGTIRKPLDEDQLLAAVGDLVARYAIEAVAVSYLFAFANPRHERRSRDLIVAHFPHLAVSISSEVDPVFREFERTCVTAFDAYVRPRVAAYIEKLSGALRAIGITAELQVMQSRGGITAAAIASEKPVTMLMSGPAAGVIGARHAGALSGYGDLITVDIGGTSCDVALVSGGKQLLSREGRIGPYPLRLSMIDVQTVGAGGGSIVWRDDSGGLRVGPQSAGSNPGPLCYGRGGTAPTVTDASLVLGFLDPSFFAGGAFRLDAAAAHAGIGRIAAEFGLPPARMAAGIHRILNERMANEIRLVSVKRGYDPRRFALVALGGAGPVNGSRLAALLSIPTVVVPRIPGVLAAFGLLVSHVEHEQTRTVGSRLDAADPDRLMAVFAELDEACAARIGRDHAGRVEIRRYVDIRYAGQSFELEVPVTLPLDRGVLAGAEEAFHALHRTLFGYDRRDIVTEIINLRSVHLAPTRDRAGGSAPVPAGPGDARKGSRPVCFDGEDYADTPIYDRDLLRAGTAVAGPAVIEQADTTTVLYPGDVACVDAAGNLIITVGRR